MIDDISANNMDLWKIEDDTTIAEPEEMNNASKIQDAVNDLLAKSEVNMFQLNERKCKEMRISFARTDPTFPVVTIKGKAMDVVPTVKLLSLNISNDLRWNCHVTEISKKVSKKGQTSRPKTL